MQDMDWNVTVLFSGSETNPELRYAKCIEKPDCQYHDVAVHCANIGCCMTLLYGMCQMQEDPGVFLGMVAWLECCKVTISIDTVSKCILSRIFPSMSIFEICVLMNENIISLFSTFLRKALFHLRFGIGVLPSPTLFRWPFPRRCCVRALRLFSSG